MKHFVKIWLLFLLIFFGVGHDLVYAQPEKAIREKEYIFFIPPDIDPSRSYPLVVALSPVGAPLPMLYAWQDVARKYKWFIYSDRISNNEIPSRIDVPRIARNVKQLLKEYPIDRNKIVAAGMSGGGMKAYALLLDHSDLFRAAVSNSGPFPPDYKVRRKRNPGKKIVILLAGKADRYYETMYMDSQYLHGLGWEVVWMPFSGGHEMAPDEYYMRVGRILEERW